MSGRDRPAYPVREKTGGLVAAVAQRVKWIRRNDPGLPKDEARLQKLLGAREAEATELRQQAVEYCRRYAAEGPESISLQDQTEGEYSLRLVRECMRDRGAYAFLLEEAEHSNVVAFPGAHRQPGKSVAWLDLSGLSPYERGRIIAQAQALATKGRTETE